MTTLAHLRTAFPHLDYALDTHNPWLVNEVIKGGKIKIVDGFVTVPEGLGLGVELDYEHLQKLHEQFLAYCPEERNDEIGMKKVNPVWQFELQRWETKAIPWNQEITAFRLAFGTIVPYLQPTKRHY